MKLILVFLATTCALGSTLSMPDLSPLAKVKAIIVPVKSISVDEKSHIQIIPAKQKAPVSATLSHILREKRSLDVNRKDDDIPQNHKVRSNRKSPSKAEITRLRNMKDSFDDLRKLKDERPELPVIKTDFEEQKKVKDERPGIQTNFDELKKLKDERPGIDTNLEQLKQLKDERPKLPNIGSDIRDNFSIPKARYKRKTPSKAEIVHLRDMKNNFDDLRKLKDERPELPVIKTDFEEQKKVKDERPDIQTNFDELRNLKDERPGIDTNLEQLKQLKDERPKLPNIGSDIRDNFSIPKARYKRKAPSKAEIVHLRNMKDSFDDLRKLKDERPELPDIKTDFEDQKKLKDERPDIQTNVDELKNLKDERPGINTGETSHVEKIRIKRDASSKPDLSPLSILSEEKPKVSEIHVDTNETSRTDKFKGPRVNFNTSKTFHVDKVRSKEEASNKAEVSSLAVLKEKKLIVPKNRINDNEAAKIKKLNPKKRSYEQNDLDDPIDASNEIDAFFGESAKNEVSDKVGATKEAVNASKMNALVIEASGNNVFDAKQLQKVSSGDSTPKAACATTEVSARTEVLAAKSPAAEKKVTSEHTNEVTAEKNGRIRVPGESVTEEEKPKSAEEVNVTATKGGIQKSQAAPRTGETRKPKKTTKDRFRVSYKTVTATRKPKGAKDVRVTASKRAAGRKGKGVPKSIELIFAIGPEGMYIGSVASERNNKERNELSSEEERAVKHFERIMKLLATAVINLLEAPLFLE